LQINLYLTFYMRFKSITLFTLFVVTLFTACNRISETDINVSNIPIVDGVNTFDTIINIVASNNGAADDNLTRLADGDQMPVGIVNDPYFGKIVAGVFIQPKPLATGQYYPFFENKDSIIAVDSVILSLGFQGIYGDSLFNGGNHPFEVREIEPGTNVTFYDSSYFNRNTGALTSFSYYPISFTGFSNYGPNLVSGSFNSTIDKIRAIKYTTYPRDSFDNVVRVKLNNSLGTRFVNYDTSSTNLTKNAYYNDSAFNRLFKGLAILPTAGTNSLMYYDLQSKTRLSFYYRVKRLGGRIDTTVTDFTNIASSAHANSIVRTPNYSITTNAPAQHIYIDGAPAGNYANLKIPGLSTLSNRLIYLAELTVEEDPISGDVLSNTGNFYQPSVLFIDWWDPVSMTYKTPKKDLSLVENDFSNYNILNFGGFRQSKVDAVSGQPVSYYTFNVTRHIQDIISFGETYADLRLYAPRYTFPTIYEEASTSWYLPDSPLKPSSFRVPGTGLRVNGRAGDGRVRLGGGKALNSAHPMKLRMVYSKL
jgi:hypothetical protein